MNRVRRAAITASLLGLLALPAAPASAATRGDESNPTLSPLLDALVKPSVRSRSVAGQARALGVPASGPGSLLRQDGRVVVNVRFDHGAIASRDDLKDAGGQVISASRRYQSATVAASPEDLPEIAAVPTVAAVSPERTPMVYGVDCEGGSAISEGLQQLQVDEARNVFGARGKGITVGILSDSFDTADVAADGSNSPIATHAAQDVLSADLPGPGSACSGQQQAVKVLQDEPSEGFDEGRAMAQIVHDLAPHAALAFATAFGKGEEVFAQNIERLAKPIGTGGADADVIVDDVGYFREPFFQEGPIAAAVQKVTNAGVTYLSAAGNNNLLDSNGNEISSWEAPEFRDAGSCPPAVGGTDCMNFEPVTGSDDTFGITVERGATLIVDLQWAEPWNGVETDLDVYLLDSEGNDLEPLSEVGTLEGRDDNTFFQKPYELITWENPNLAEPEEVQLVIKRCSGLCNPDASASAKPRLKFILLENGSGVSATEYPQSEGDDVVGPTVFGHAGAASAISIGAVRTTNPIVPRVYSSRGPVTHYFAPVSGSDAAAPLPTPQVLAKPDLIAPDCVANTFFSRLEAGKWRFCGTSAAAPHAAAVAALLKQADPLSTPAEISTTLTGTASPVAAPPKAAGAGMVDAFAALQSLVPFSIDDPPSTELLPVPKYETEKPKEPEKPPVATPNDPPVGGATSSPTPTTPADDLPAQEPKTTPATLIKTHPRKLVRTRKALARVVFRFGSEPAGATFRCQFDGSRWRACAATVVRWFGLGPHAVRVQARGKDGSLDASPAVYRFRVARTLRAPRSGHRALRR